MPNGQPRRSLDASRARGAVRLRRARAAARGYRAHRRLVPRAQASRCARLTGSSSPPSARSGSSRPAWRSSLTHDGSVYGDPTAAARDGRRRAPRRHRRDPGRRRPRLSPSARADNRGHAPRLHCRVDPDDGQHPRSRAARASYCLLEVARRVAGSLYAIAAAAVWLLLPIVAVPLFVPKYHGTYVDHVLPAFYGLTLQPNYLAMVLSLVAAFLCLRAATGARPAHAGLAAGLAAALAMRACRLPPESPSGSCSHSPPPVARAPRLRRSLASRRVALTLVWRARALPDASSRSATRAGTASSRHGSASASSSGPTVFSSGFRSRARSGAPARAARAALSAAGWRRDPCSCRDPGRVIDGGVFVVLHPPWPAYALLVAAIPLLVPTRRSRLPRARAPGRERRARA